MVMVSDFLSRSLVLLEQELVGRTNLILFHFYDSRMKRIVVFEYF